MMTNKLIYRFFASLVGVTLPALPAVADDFVRDPEPAILEVRYMRHEVTDTTKRDKNYFDEETRLRIGKGKSLFCSVQHMWRDSIMAVDPSAYWEMESASFHKDPREHDRTTLQRSGRYWSSIYKNYPEGKLTETNYFDMEHWKYVEDWEKPEWEITDESKDIMGYECFKAETDYRGRHWTAWFTPEIPIEEGPWKLCGLPGLILEAYDTNRDYSFTANAVFTNPNLKVGYLAYNERKGYSKVTRDKYLNNWWRYQHSNFAAKIRAAFGVGPKATPDENKPKVVNRDKEETDYPHDL